ncbi:MAG: hypothetical protein WD552_00510 [Candidatus Paceibacterota bacterium]
MVDITFKFKQTGGSPGTMEEYMYEDGSKIVASKIPSGTYRIKYYTKGDSRDRKPDYCLMTVEVVNGEKRFFTEDGPIVAEITNSLSQYRHAPIEVTK